MNDSMDLRNYITIGLKWWWLIALSIIIGAAVGYFISQRQVPVYEATTTLIVGQSIIQNTESDFDISTSQQLAQTYADMAQRQPVLQGVVDTLSLPDSWQALETRVQANPVPRTQLLEITVEATSPEEARVTANEIARQLILLSPTEQQKQEQAESQRFIRERLIKLQAKIEAGEQKRGALEAELDSPLSVEQVQKIQREIENLENLMATWEANYGQLLSLTDRETSANSLTIIEPAQANPRPIQRQTQLNILRAGLVGLALALGLIFLLEYLDDTFKSADDLKQTLALTPLGTVNHIKGKNYHDKLVASEDIFSPASEAYRMIRSSMQFLAVDHPINSIMITSSVPAEGKSITVANLGVVMAQAGLKTIIVDADLRRPIQHEIFQVPNLNGLTDLLCSPELEFNSHMRKPNIENLYIITSGVIPPNPSELLGSERMGQLVTGLSELADMIIYDSPPTLAVTDATVLSNRVDGVVLVAEAGQTRRELVKQAVVKLQQAGAHLLGGVLNQVKNSKGSYHYYQYYHYYSPNGRRAAGNRQAETKPPRKWLGLPFSK